MSFNEIFGKNVTYDDIRVTIKQSVTLSSDNIS